MPKSDLEIMCGSNALVSFPVLQSCIQECALGSCCFGYGHTNCASDNSDACLKYEPCENLPLFNQPQNSPMSPLEVICSPNMLQTVEGFAICSMVCEPVHVRNMNHVVLSKSFHLHQKTYMINVYRKVLLMRNY